MPKAKTENVQLGKNLENIESAPPTILHQNDHKVEDFDAAANKKKQTKNNNLE